MFSEKSQQSNVIVAKITSKPQMLWLSDQWNQASEIVTIL